MEDEGQLREVAVKFARHTIGITLVMILACSAVACKKERYEIREDKHGRVVRLDKKTGEVTIVSGDKQVTIESQEEQEKRKHQTEAVKRQQAERLQAWAIPIEWGGTEYAPDSVAESKLTTVCVDGQLHYKLSFSYRADVLRPFPTYTYGDPNRGPVYRHKLVFLDADGFERYDVKVRWADIKEQSSGGPWPTVIGETAEGRTICPQEYGEFFSWKLEWN